MFELSEKEFLILFSNIRLNLVFFHLSFYQDFPSATFDSLVQLIHSGMTTQQRSDLLNALVSLEADDTAAKTAKSTNLSQEDSTDKDDGTEVSASSTTVDRIEPN